MGSGTRERTAPERTDLLRAARLRFLHGMKIDIAGLAEEIGVSRATAYRWAGNVDELTGEVLASLSRDIFRRSVAEAEGTGAERLVDALARGLRYTAQQPYRIWLESQNPETALRIVASNHGAPQATTISLWEALLEEEAAKGAIHLPVDAHTLAYSIVRISESFLYADLIVGEEPDITKAIEILRLLLMSLATSAPAVRS